MKGGRLPLGYTIIEVMIVLGVSGILFLIASNFISGKQERTSFQQGSNEFASRIQSIITQVSDGHFTDISINCSAPIATSNPDIFPVGSPPPQDQNNCVFLGKLLHFSPGGVGNYNQYDVYTLAGARLNGNTPVTTLSTPTPFSNTRLAPVVPINPAVVITKHEIMPQNLDVGPNSMVVTDGGGPDPSAYSLGFMQGLGTNGSHPGWYQSGSHTIQMVYVKALKNVASGPPTEGLITPSLVIPAISATICITDNVRSANIIIGAGNNNQLQVEVKQLGVATTCP